MKVTNINGTSDNSCKCGSWLAHWKKISGQKLPDYCPVKSCIRKPEVGAHVQKADTSDKKWYIVPLCIEHNLEVGKTLEIADDIALVSANVSETCGK